MEHPDHFDDNPAWWRGGEASVQLKKRSPLRGPPNTEAQPKKLQRDIETPKSQLLGLQKVSLRDSAPSPV